MNIAEIISIAGFMGLVSSLHCVGMCGPLAFALPVAHRNTAGRITGGSLYNLGRISTYAVMGLVFGLAGQSIISTRWQSMVSLILGALILAYLLFPKKWIPQGFDGAKQKPFLFLRSKMGALFHSRKYTSLFSIGLLNGLLPCGMVYLALTSSLVTGSALKGALFMFAFGMGTVPAMLTAVCLGSLMNQQLRLRLRKAVPFVLGLMACLLILRGLNLGIPYVSPSLPQGNGDAVHCH